MQLFGFAALIVRLTPRPPLVLDASEERNRQAADAASQAYRRVMADFEAVFGVLATGKNVKRRVQEANTGKEVLR